MEKYCIDCKHCVINYYTDKHECHHPKSLKNSKPNLVTGLIPEDYWDCEFMRHWQRGSAEETYQDGSKMSDYACTKDGAWFEPKPEPQPEPLKKSWWSHS